MVTNSLFCSMLLLGSNLSYWSVTYNLYWLIDLGRFIYSAEPGRKGVGGGWVVPRASQQWHNLSTLCVGHDICRRRSDETSVEVEMLLLVFNFIRILNLSVSSPTLFLHLPFSQVKAALEKEVAWDCVCIFAHRVHTLAPHWFPVPVINSLINYLIDCYQSKPIENCSISSS